MRGFKAYLVSAAVLCFFSIGWNVPVSTNPAKRSPVNLSLLDQTLYVSDSSFGIRIYDVSNPTAPRPELMIPLGGNRGTAVKDDVVYANSWGSILAIQITDDGYEVVKKIEVEPEPVMVNDVVIDREPGFGCSACTPSAFDALETAPTSGSTGGSYATFAVIDDYLYYLDHASIVTLDISTPADPKEISRTYAGWDFETLFPTTDYLFVGGTRGMYVFDRSRPAEPSYIGQVQHFRGCDPVVISGGIAFVTLRGGNACGQTEDVLLTVDVTNPKQPKVIAQTPVATPYGLALNESRLYVSTGRNGFKLFDISVPEEPTVVGQWSDRATKDFIWAEELMYVMGFEDVSIYDVSNPGEPAYLSRLE